MSEARRLMDQGKLTTQHAQFRPASDESEADWEALEKARAEEKERQERRSRINSQSHIFKQCVGKRYSSLDLHQFEVTTDAQRLALDNINAFCGNVREHTMAGAGLVLFGNSGTGKDMLAVCAAKAAIMADCSIIWKSGVELLGDFRDAIDSERSEHDLIHGMFIPDVLVLSDPLPPSGNLTDFQRAQLYRVLDGRYCRKMSIWATINVANRQELNERLGVQLADRLLDGALVIPCNWPSYRSTRRIPLVTDVSRNDASTVDEA